MTSDKPKYLTDLMMRSEKIILVILLLGVFAVGVPVAFFSGENVLPDHPALAQFSDFVAQMVPAIPKFEAQSRFPPGVAKLVFAIDYLFASLLFLTAMAVTLRIWLWDRDRNNQVLNQVSKNSAAPKTAMRKVWFVLGYLMFLSFILTDLGVFPNWGVGFYTGRHFADDPSHWFNKILFSSRGGLGLGAAIFCVSVALVYWGTLFLTLNIRAWYGLFWERACDWQDTYPR